MALPQARHPARLGLVASGARVTRDNVPGLRRLEQPWQRRALNYYDLLGEVRVASHFYSRMLQRLRIFPGTRVSDDRVEPIKSGLPVELLDRIQDPGGGRTKILKDYGRLMFITGEGYLLGTGLEDHEHWRFVWRDELRFDAAGRVIAMLAPDVPATDWDMVSDNDFTPLDPHEAVAYRFWTPHPRASMLPDSPMRSTLDIAEELVVLTSSVYATATSRLVRSKFLLMPLEASPQPIVPGRGEDPLNDPFMADLAAHFEKALEDPAHARALAPFVAWIQAEYIQQVRDLELHNTDTDYLERDLRSETIKRLALGWDMPPEAILGLGDTNHWSAWAVREDMWVLHGAPIAEQFCDDIAESYLRPALRSEGYDGWEDVVVAFDETAVVVNPDRSKDADEAWDRGAIGYAAYRNAKRFVEADAQDEDEHAEWLAIKLRDSTLVPEEDNPNISPAGEPGPPPGEPGPVSEQTNLPQNGSASFARDRILNENDRLLILGAAQMALQRCRELAGAKLRTRRDSCPECFQNAANVPNSMVATTMSADQFAALGVDPADLVKTGSDGFRRLLRTWGMSESYTDRLAEQIEKQAIETLFDEQPVLRLVG